MHIQGSGASPEQLEALRQLLAEVDRHEVQVDVLEALVATAKEARERPHGPQHGGAAGGELWIQVIEALRFGAAVLPSASPQSLPRVEVELCGKLGGQSAHAGRTGAGQGSQSHVTWGETLTLPLAAEGLDASALLTAPDDASGDLRLSLVGSDGSELGSVYERVGRLRDQCMQRVWLDLRTGWRIHVAVQWVHSRAALLGSHITALEGKLQEAREALVAHSERMQHLVPREVWQGAHPAPLGGGCSGGSGFPLSSLPSRNGGLL